MHRPLVILVLVALCAGCASPAAAPPELTLDFRGLWFSGDELARVRSGEAHVTPSADIALASWDAISTEAPHPEIVNAQIRIAVPLYARRRASVVTLREEWRIGERGSEETAQWSESAQRSSPPIDLVPGSTISVSLPVAVGDMVRRQIRAGRTLYRLAVRAELRDTPQAPVLASAQAMLPILTLGGQVLNSQFFHDLAPLGQIVAADCERCQVVKKLRIQDLTPT